MGAHESMEHAEHAEHASGSNKKIALLIAVIALFLALSETLGKGAQTEAISKNVEASKLWAFFQAKSIRRTTVQATAEHAKLSLAWSEVASTTVRRMLLAWKNAHRFEASTFLLMESVCAPLPSVSENARNSAITAISNAIFLLEPEACSACSACSMLSCAPMILSPLLNASTIDRTPPPAQVPSRCDGSVSG